MILTATTLRNIATCPRRAWLDRHDAELEPDETVPVALIRGIRHEHDIHTATTGPIETTVVRSWQEGVALTRSLMDDGVPAILGGYLEHTETLASGRAVTLRGRVDRLVRVRLGRRAVYQAIEIKKSLTLQPADLLQMDFYLYILARRQNYDGVGVFWVGRREDGTPQDEISHELDYPRLQAALAAAVATLEQADAPHPSLASRCRDCLWLTACEETVTRQRDISILPRLSTQSKTHLRQAGIQTLEQFAALSIEELQQFKGIKTTAVALKASAQAFVEDRPVWFNPLPASLPAGGWMLDIETAALPGGDGLPWSIGWSDDQGNGQIVVVAPYRENQPLELPEGWLVTLVPDQDAAWRKVSEGVAGDGKPIYHWTRFDAGVLRNTAPDEVRQALAPRMRDLHHTFVHTVRLPQRSYSIKKVAAYFGFSWSGYQEWWRAETDYRYWLDTGDTRSLIQACAYLRDDVLALAIVWSWLVANRPA